MLLRTKMLICIKKPIELTLVLAFVSLGIAQADFITVNNQSFEILPAGGLNHPYPGGGGYSEDAIPSWTNLQTPGPSGQYAPGAIPGAEYNYLPDGVTFAYTNGGTISQTVAATVEVGDVYTLSVDLGNRKDISGGTGNIDLLVDGIEYIGVGGVIPNGGWAVYTATYTGLLADAGDAITIELNNPAGSGGQADFDDVTLYDSVAGSPTPEPGTASVLLGALAGLALTAWFRKARPGLAE